MSMKNIAMKSFLVASLLILSVSIVYAATTPSISLHFTKKKYEPADILSAKVSATLPKTVDTKKNALQYVGVGWIRPGESDFIDWKWDSETPCAAKECTREIALDGTSNTYKGLNLVPMVWGRLDGKVVDTAVLGRAYPVELSIAPVKVVRPENQKPVVKVTADKVDASRGDVVKISVEASGTENDLKSISLKIPLLNKDETRQCNDRQLNSCKFDFSVPMAETGDVAIEAVAEDLEGKASDKSSATVKVANVVKLSKGLNVLIVDGNILKNEAQISKFGGMDKCTGADMKILHKKNAFAYETKWVSASYLIQPDDVAVIVYCPLTSQETYVDPYIYGWED